MAQAKKLASIERGDYRLHAVINDLIEAYELTPAKISEMTGVSARQIHELKNNPDATMREANALKICDAFGLPEGPIIYANAIARLPKERRERIEHEIEHQAPAPNVVPMGQGPSVTVYANIVIPHGEWNRASAGQRPRLISRYSRAERYPGVIAAPSAGHVQNHLYLRHFGSHMVSTERQDVSVPDGAIVEVAPLRPGQEPGQGALVFARVRDFPAGCYLWYREDEEGSGSWEEFHEIARQNDNPPRIHIIMGRPNIDPDVDDQRSIVGIATRIVDHRLNPGV